MNPPLSLSPILRVGAVLRALVSVAPLSTAPRPCARTGDDTPRVDTGADPPANAFVPVPGCWACVLLDDVARAAWHGEDGLTLADWLSVTASGLRHRLWDHGLSPAP
ncbi:hypothetical protein [Streptomyces sp. NPDC087294]|uniref:hypothetical protein n=1 Tax=Streptomyces sp. NPDC087294 TaxID=3365777 RepID=UPI0037F375BD